MEPIHDFTLQNTPVGVGFRILEEMRIAFQPDSADHSHRDVMDIEALTHPPYHR